MMTKQSDVERLAETLEKIRDTVNLKPQYIFQHALHPSHGVERMHRQSLQMRVVAQAILDEGYVRKDRVELELEIARRALWIMADTIEKRSGIELVFGEGYTETDFVTDSLAAAKDQIIKRKED